MVQVGETPYLVAFSTVPGVGPVRLKLLINYFGSARSAWLASDAELTKVGLPKDVLPVLLMQKRKLDVSQYLKDIDNRGIKVITIFDVDYPERLKNIPDPPNVLYLKTSLSTLEFKNLVAQKTMAVVGTRKVTGYGREVTEQLTAALVASGFTIISGLALGVDGIAHGTTLNCGGRTVAVLGAGVEVVYPREHQGLYNSILEHEGAIVSEVAPEKFVARGVFPARNRIISGLAEAVLITEGAIDSGSLITARAALDQGREVFAVPGPINSALAEGTNFLLKQGAKLVTGVGDIINDLGYEIKDTNGGIQVRKQVVGDTAEEQKIIDILVNEPKEFDDLIKLVTESSGSLAAILSKMELKGQVKCAGLRYSLV